MLDVGVRGWRAQAQIFDFLPLNRRWGPSFSGHPKGLVNISERMGMKMFCKG